MAQLLQLQQQSISSYIIYCACLWQCLNDQHRMWRPEDGATCK